MISVVIPALNEEGTIAGAVESARPEAEVLVVDGGSVDRTREAAATCGARVLSSPGGRGRQMNRGAREAGGDILLFLHADTRLPPGWSREVTGVLGGRRVAAGAFRLGIGAPGAALRLVEMGANLRSRWLGLTYGDQALFLPAATFHELGGFPELPIMEDVALVRLLRRRGRVALAAGAVSTSPRRWRRHGVLRVTLLNNLLLLGFCLGVPPGRLASWYGGRDGAEAGEAGLRRAPQNAEALSPPRPPGAGSGARSGGR